MRDAQHYSLQFSSDITKMIKLSEHATHMGEMGSKHFGMQLLKKGNHLENIRLEGKAILKFILKKQDRTLWTELSWLRIWTRGGLLGIR